MTTVLNDKVVKIRKEHVCWGCAEKFPVGSRLRFQKSLDDAGFLNTYWCRTCDKTYSEVSDDFHYDDIRFGELKEYTEVWNKNVEKYPRTYDKAKEVIVS